MKITTPILKSKIVTGTYVAINPVLRVIILATVITGGYCFSKGYNFGKDLYIAQISELKSNGVKAEVNYSGLSARYVALQKAKPLDTPTACLSWYMQQDLADVKRRICGR